MNLNKKYILAIDLGTTGNRAIIFDKEQKIISKSYKEFRQYFPKEGWVEHDPMEILQSTISVIKDALKKGKIKVDDIAAAGITNQRETTVIWDKKTGKPIYNAIVWQCKRTSGYCEELKKKGKEAFIRNKTGLLVDPYFSATKIRWILENVAGARKKADDGELCFGTIDTWILWNLTKGIHATDYSNASRTLIFNIHTLKWDEELLKLFDIPKKLLPEVKSSSGEFGKIHSSILPGNIPITGIIGDQQSAMFAQGCYAQGIVKNTYGTGCFAMMNTGTKAIASKNKLLTTIAWNMQNKTEYALEGSVFMGGASVQWLRDGLKIIENASDTEKLADEVDDNGGVYFVPALVGLGAPYWDMQARGMIIGITRGTTKNHIVRATLEAIAFQSYDLIIAMENDAKIKIKMIKVDGGAAANRLLMQFQSDLLKLQVVKPKIIETTALGAAGMAGLAVKFWKSREDFQNRQKIDCIFKPSMDGKKRKMLLQRWKKAVSRARDWI